MRRPQKFEKNLPLRFDVLLSNFFKCGVKKCPSYKLTWCDFTNFSNQVSADSLNFCFRSLSVLLTSFCYKAQLCKDEMRNLMKTNDLQQFPSPTESHELNAPHGGLWRSLRQSTDTKGQDLPLRRRPRQIFQIVTCLFKTRA